MVAPGHGYQVPDRSVHVTCLTAHIYATAIVRNKQPRNCPDQTAALVSRAMSGRTTHKPRPVPRNPASPRSARPRAHENILDLLGVAPSLRRVLRYFALRPTARPHLRRLQRELRLGSASVQRDLTRMTEAGVLQAMPDESTGTVRYAFVPHRFWEVLRTLVAASDEPAELLREALRDVPGVDAAFLFGSAATGTAQPESDIDLLVVGDAVATRPLYRNLFEVGQILRRPVNALRYTRSTLAARLASGARFTRSVLEGPKVWLAGDPSAIAPIATAAGVRFRADGYESSET